LALFAAEARIGLDAGNDRPTSAFSQAIKSDLILKHGIQLRDDVHGLDVYAEQPAVRRLGVEAYASSTRLITGYEAPLLGFFDTQHVFSPKQQLALELYNLSHFENVPKTRFLNLITVVEVLAIRRSRPKSVRALVGDLLTAVDRSELAEEERKLLREGLANLRQESISRACKDYVSHYASAEEVDFFSKCYKARSELLHNGWTDRAEASHPAPLDELVSRILVRSLTGSVTDNR